MASAGKVEYRGRVRQGGMIVATVEGRGRKFVEREIAHYALVYGQDGPVETEVKPIARRLTRRK